MVCLVDLIVLVELIGLRYGSAVPAMFTFDDAKRLLAAARTAAVLEPAKAAVLGALAQAVAAEEISEEDAATYAATINAFRDAFALDDWLFWQPPSLNRRICNYPLCFNTPRSSPKQRAGGNPPAYCAETNERDQPHAISQNAIRRREKLHAAREEHGADNSAGPAAVVTGPVTEARTTFTTGVDLVVRTMEDLTAAVHSLREDAARGRDDALVQAEIDAVRHQANQEVERESALRAVLEQRAIKAEEQAARAGAELDELRAAFQQAEEQAERDAADRAVLVHAALLALTATRATAERYVHQARLDAEQQIEQARARFTDELDRRTQEMNAAIEQANNDRAAADRAVAKAEQDLAKEVEHVAVLTAANNDLRDAAITREREFQETLAALGTEHQHTTDGLRATITTLQERLETARAAHDSALEDLRREQSVELAARLEEVKANADRLKDVEHAALSAQVTSLTLQLQTRDEQLQQIRDAERDAERDADGSSEPEAGPHQDT